jgi:ubiquinol-cytochrome c reductase cytochrome b subunit
MIEMIANPAAPRFYGKKNDRMPAFAAENGDAEHNILSRRQIELIVDWLREDDAGPREDHGVRRQFRMRDRQRQGAAARAGK